MLLEEGPKRVYAPVGQGGAAVCPTCCTGGGGVPHLLHGRGAHWFTRVVPRTLRLAGVGPHRSTHIPNQKSQPLPLTFPFPYPLHDDHDPGSDSKRYSECAQPIVQCTYVWCGVVVAKPWRDMSLYGPDRPRPV